MKAGFFLITFYLFGQHIVAQTTFSISPLINYKLLVCGYDYDQRFGFYSENHPSSIQNPYYEFGAKRISHRSSINIGLRLSLFFREKKDFLSLEWSQDEVGTMSKTRALATANTLGIPTPTYKTYGIGISYFQNAFVFNRFSLNFGKQINVKSETSKFYFLTDLSFTKMQDNRSEYLYTNDTTTNNSVYYHNNAQWVQISNKAQLWGGKYLLLGIGFRADIRPKINNKSVYLFTLECMYRQGFKPMVASLSETLINDSGQLIEFSNGLGSKGSGIYFQLSRDFNIKSIKQLKGNK